MAVGLLLLAACSPPPAGTPQDTPTAPPEVTPTTQPDTPTVLPEATPTTQPDTLPASPEVTPTTQSETPPVGLGQPFSLATGEEKVIEAEGLTVEFVEVAGDSRCPSDVDCFWAGEVTVVIAVYKNGQSLGEFELTLGVSPDEAAVTDVDGYTIQLLEVTPYPISTETIASSDYQISLTVSAAGSPPTTPSGPAGLPHPPSEPPGDDLTGPPAIRLLINDTPINGLPGSFCWTPPAGEDGMPLPGMCADALPPDFDKLDFTPLPAGEPLRLLLDPPLPGTLTLYLYAAFPGQPAADVELVPGDERVEWAYDLPPGRYMLSVFGVWGERGDATTYFGVLIP
jgi:hypothetical protein